VSVIDTSSVTVEVCQPLEVEMRALVCGIFLSLFLSSCALQHKRGTEVDPYIEIYRSELSAAESCYARALKSDPSLSGSLNLIWAVDDKGQVLEPRIQDSELPNSSLENCLLNHLRQVKFPPTKKWSKITVEYRLNLVKRTR